MTGILFKRGELSDDLLIKMGADTDQVVNCKFIKTAMVDRVMYNLNMYHKKATGSYIWDDESFASTRTKVAEAMSVSDIISEDTLGRKIDSIIDMINNHQTGGVR